MSDPPGTGDGELAANMGCYRTHRSKALGREAPLQHGGLPPQLPQRQGRRQLGHLLGAQLDGVPERGVSGGKDGSQEKGGSGGRGSCGESEATVAPP